jgi:hypothetical protein
MTDLVKRLRETSDDWPACLVALEQEAADHIEKLERENNDMVIHFDGLVARIEKLEAALRFYACDCKPDDGCGVEYYDGGAYCGYTARKALEGKDD